MNMNRECYGTGEAIDSVYNELNQLQACYMDLLEQESLRTQVNVLKAIIEDYQMGSSSADEALREYGDALLCDIKEKLEAATAEQERMLEESPSVAAHEAGGTTHAASRATALAVDAREKLAHTLARKTTH